MKHDYVRALNYANRTANCMSALRYVDGELCSDCPRKKHTDFTDLKEAFEQADKNGHVYWARKCGWAITSLGRQFRQQLKGNF